MKKTTIAVAVAAILACAQSAQARQHHYHSRHARHHLARHQRSAEPHWGWMPGDQSAWQQRPFSTPGSFGFSAPGFGNTGNYEHSPSQEREASGDYGAYHRRRAYREYSSYRGGSDPRPAAWCGWEMRRLVGSDPGREYNLARNWAHWGRSGPAGVGAVVVWPHHVGKIVGREGGQWVIESGNDGHALRARPRSIAGAIAIRWG